MSEKQMRRTFCQLVSELDPVNVENLLCGRTGIGTPDVNLATGAWCELKYVKRWPSKASTPLRLPHYTDEQKSWALRRESKGGLCFLVLQVGREWFVFDTEGAMKVGQLTRQELTDTALVYFPRLPTPVEICPYFK